MWLIIFCHCCRFSRSLTIQTLSRKLAEFYTFRVNSANRISAENVFNSVEIQKRICWGVYSPWRLQASTSRDWYRSKLNSTGKYWVRSTNQETKHAERNKQLPWFSRIGRRRWARKWGSASKVCFCWRLPLCSRLNENRSAETNDVRRRRVTNSRFGLRERLFSPSDFIGVMYTWHICNMSRV